MGSQEISRTPMREKKESKKETTKQERRRVIKKNEQQTIYSSLLFSSPLQSSRLVSSRVASSRFSPLFLYLRWSALLRSVRFVSFHSSSLISSYLLFGLYAFSSIWFALFVVPIHIPFPHSREMHDMKNATCNSWRIFPPTCITDGSRPCPPRIHSASPQLIPDSLSPSRTRARQRFGLDVLGRGWFLEEIET